LNSPKGVGHMVDPLGLSSKLNSPAAGQEIPVRWRERSIPMKSRFLSYLRTEHRSEHPGRPSSGSDPGSPGGSWTRTTLEILGTSVRTTSSGQHPYLLSLEIQERDESGWDSGKPQNSGTNRLSLVFEVEGKEIALFTGLVGRPIKVLGYQPEELLSYEELLQENEELRHRLEEFAFQVSELHSFQRELGRSPVPLPRSG